MRKTSAAAIHNAGNSISKTSSSGVHYWNVRDDRVYCDAAAAELFGFSETEGLDGLPIECYLSRIHPEDRPRIAKCIHDAMLSGEPYHEDYRTVQPDGATIDVVAIGRWFRDASGDPNHYSGILFPKAPMAITSLSVQQLCLIAYDMAKAEGHVEAADKIVEALAHLDRSARQMAPETTHH